LAEKNYENLVEALTNDSIDTVVASSSNPILPFPPSSSKFSSSLNQSDIDKIGESEIYHDSKGDIDD